MGLKRNDNYYYTMLHLAKMLSTYAISCVHQTNNGIVKSWLDENCRIHDDGKVSTEDVDRRKTNTAKRTSWESTNKRDSLLFDDQNLTLCIKIPSNIDNHFDLYYATIRPTLGSLKIITSDNQMISIRDKEMVAAMCLFSCMSLSEILKMKDEKSENLIEEIVHKDRIIQNLKREMEIPVEKTRRIIREKLSSLGRQYGREFVLSKDADTLVDEYVGDNITPLLKALEHTASIKAEIYDDLQITIYNTDIHIKAERKENETQGGSIVVGVREKRHARLIAYLEKLEHAYNAVDEKGLRATAANIANEMNVTPASITMWFNNHSEDAKRLCDADINLCKNLRRNFEPLKEALAGKKNKPKTA